MEAVCSSLTFIPAYQITCFITQKTAISLFPAVKMSIFMNVNTNKLCRLFMSKPSSAFKVKWASLLKVQFIKLRKNYSNYFIFTKVHSSFYCYRYLPSSSFHSFTHTKLSCTSILQNGHRRNDNLCIP